VPSPRWQYVLQRAQAELLGEGESLVVMSGGLVNVQRLVTQGNLAEDPAGMRLVTTSCVGVGALEEMSCQRSTMTRCPRQGNAQATVWPHGVPAPAGIPTLALARPGFPVARKGGPF
jgi:hypothetical protein